MISVFLSDSSKDKPFVRELADFLECDDEIAVWLDEREIAPGDNIVGSIGAGLRVLPTASFNCKPGSRTRD